MRTNSPSQLRKSLRTLIRSSDFCSDLKLVIGIEKNEFDIAIDAVRSFVGFLDFETAVCNLNEGVSKQTAALIWNFARNLGTLRENFSCSEEELADAFIVELRDQNKAPRAPQFDEEDLTQLKVRLGALAERFHGIEQHRKAVTLSEATGNMFRDIAIICDVRPVFDDERAKIEGLFPITTLQLTYETTEGVEKVETILSPAQVAILADVVLVAKRKLDAVNQFTAKCNVFEIGTPDVWET